jgi:hypothetical protein
MARHKQWSRIDLLDRAAGGDLLAAMIISGAERLMPLQEIIEVSDFLEWLDMDKARQLSGYIVRGEEHPADIKAWSKMAGELARSYVEREA